jgi:hypothetical protein
MNFNDVNDDNEEPSDVLYVGEEDYEYWDIIGFDFYVNGYNTKKILFCTLYYFFWTSFQQMHKYYIKLFPLCICFSILTVGYYFNFEWTSSSNILFLKENASYESALLCDYLFMWPSCL